MKKISPLILISFLLLTSCVTKNESIVLDSMPYWVTNEIINEDLIYYTIEGTGFSVVSATSNAINNFFSTLNKSIEIIEKESFVTNLSENYYYEPLGIKIEKKYIQQYDDKSYYIIYLVSANKAKIQESELQKTEKIQLIKNNLLLFKDESDLLYRENKDFLSIKTLLQAYVLAEETGFYVESSGYLDTIISRISALSISVYAKNNKNSLEIRINRTQGFINPLVENAEILALYNTKDIDFNNYLASESLFPFKNNNFVFYLDNKNINLKGLVIFKLDFTEEIKKLEKLDLTETARKIENVINERVFSYENISDFKNKKVIITTIENEINQDKRESVTLDFFSTRLEKLGANVIINQDIDINNLEQLKIEADYIFVFRAEILEKEDGLKPYVFSHGSLEIYNLSNFALIYDSDLIDSIAIKDTMEESEKESLINVAKKTYHNYL